MNKTNMKENDEHHNDFDDYNLYDSPGNFITDINESEDSDKSQFANTEFEIKEHEKNRQILILESRALSAEEANIKYKKQIEQIDKDLEQQKLMYGQCQLDLFQSKQRYDELVSKLFLSFNCHSIDEIFQIPDKLVKMESKIAHLTKNLEQAQMEISKMSINPIERNTTSTTDMVLSSLSNVRQEEIEQLTRKLKRSNDQISIKNQEIELLKSQISEIRKNDENIQSEYAQIKASSSNFEKENQDLQLSYKQLYDEFTEFKEQSKKSSENTNRFKILEQISKRLDPKFLLINDQNVLYPFFDNLSMLLQGVSDMEIEPQDIVQGIMQISEVIQKTVNEVANNDKDNEEVAQLKSQISDYEDQIEKLQDDLKEMLEDNSINELVTWMKKYKDLENELNSLKQSQSHMQVFNQSLDFS